MQGKRVLVIEDGPTLTHGSMSMMGAGVVAARAAGAAAIVDPTPYAVAFREHYGNFEKAMNARFVSVNVEGAGVEWAGTAERTEPGTRRSNARSPISTAPPT